MSQTTLLVSRTHISGAFQINLFLGAIFESPVFSTSSPAVAAQKQEGFQREEKN